MPPDPVLCLASASPRRRDLLATIGVTVEVKRTVWFPVNQS